MAKRRMLGWLILAVLPLAGCAPAPISGLPNGVSVSVLQTRMDRGDRQLEIRVENLTEQVLTVTAARFASNQLAEPAVWRRGPSDIRAGLTVDLRVDLPAASCDYKGTPTSQVWLAYTLEDGSTGEASVIPDDPIGQVPGLTADDCLVEAVAEHALISPPERLDWTPGTRTPAVLELAVEPTGAPGTLEIHGTANTILFTIVEDAALTNGFGLTVEEDSGPATLRIGVVPSLCQAHAVADDKRGTYFPLLVTVDGAEQRTMYLRSGDRLRADLYTFIGDYCESRELVPRG